MLSMQVGPGHVHPRQLLQVDPRQRRAEGNGGWADERRESWRTEEDRRRRVKQRRRGQERGHFGEGKARRHLRVGKQNRGECWRRRQGRRALAELLQSSTPFTTSKTALSWFACKRVTCRRSRS